MDAARHILYADDDEHDRFFMSRAFAQLSPPHKLATATDGVAAIHELERAIPDLLLLDVKMPRTNGFEVLRWVRTQPAPLRTVPAIMLSSSPDPRDFAAAEQLKAIGYFVKPAAARELEQFVVSITHFLHQPPESRQWKCPSAPCGCRAFTH